MATTILALLVLETMVSLAFASHYLARGHVYSIGEHLVWALMDVLIVAGLATYATLTPGSMSWQHIVLVGWYALGLNMNLFWGMQGGKVVERIKSSDSGHAMFSMAMVAVALFGLILTGA